jgi:hypothetical protein
VRAAPAAHRGRGAEVVELGTARLFAQNGLLDRDFPPYDALARRTGGVMYRAGHTLDARAIHDRERWLEECLA